MLTERRRPPLATQVTVGRMTLPWPALDRDHGLANLLIPWAIIALLLMGASSSAIAALDLPGPADHLRLRQVEALLAGQGWWDVARQGTMGIDQMASRLVDLPLALLILAADVFVGSGTAVRFAVVAVPLLQLLAAMALMRGTLRCLDFKGGAANLGTLIIPLLPLTLGVFAPLRIAHDGWQAVLALAMLRLVVDRRAIEHKAVLAGACAALLAAVSLDGLPFLAAAWGCYAVSYLREGRAAPMAGFLTGLMLASAPSFALTRNPEAWSQADPGALSWPHLAAFAAAACGACLALRFRRPPLPLQRLALLVGTGTAALAPLLLVFGPAVFAPDVDHPIIALRADQVGMLLSMLALFGFAAMTAHARMARSGNPRGWLAVSLCAGAMCALSLVTFRSAVVAQLMMTPLLALLLRDALRVASRFDAPLLRVPAILVALLSLTPAGGSIAGAAAMRVQGEERVSTASGGVLMPLRVLR